MATFLHIAKQQNYNAIFNELVNLHPALDDIIPYSMEIFKSHTNFTSFNQTDFQNTFIDIAANSNCLQEYPLSLCLYAEFITTVVNRKSLLSATVDVANHYIEEGSSEGSVERSCQFGIPGDEYTEEMTHEIYLKNKILKERDPAFIKMLSKNWANEPPKHTRGNRRTKVFELCQATDYDYALSVISDSNEKTIDFADKHSFFLGVDIMRSANMWGRQQWDSRRSELWDSKIKADHAAFSSLIKKIRNMPKYLYDQTELDSTVNCICQLLPQLYKQISELYTLHSHPEVAQEIYERALSQRLPTKPAIAKYTRDAFPEFADFLEQEQNVQRERDIRKSIQQKTKSKSPTSDKSSDDTGVVFVFGVIIAVLFMLANIIYGIYSRSWIAIPGGSITSLGIVIACKMVDVIESKKCGHLQPFWFWIILVCNVFALVFFYCYSISVQYTVAIVSLLSFYFNDQ